MAANPPLKGKDLQQRMDEATRLMIQRDRIAANAAAIAMLQTAMTTEAAARIYGDMQEGQARDAADRLRPVVYGSSGLLDRPRLYVATVAVAAGNAVFNMVDGTAAIFASVLNVQCAVNDATTVYSFAWTISGDMRTLTVNCRKAATPVLSLLGLNILAQPANAPNGTLVQVLITGL